MDLVTEAFSGYLGFPETAGGLRLYAKGLCGIVWFLPRSEIIRKLYPNEPEKWTPHHIIGDRPDHEWLMEEAIAVSERFPMLIQLRRIYDQYLPPRDGRNWEEMMPR